jgi:hypothetical protein
MRQIQPIPGINHPIIITYAPACPIAHLLPYVLRLLKRLAKMRLVTRLNTRGTLLLSHRRYY